MQPHVCLSPDSDDLPAKRGRFAFSPSPPPSSPTHIYPLQAKVNPLGSSATPFEMYCDVLRRLEDVETKHDIRVSHLQHDIESLYRRTAVLLNFRDEWNREQLVEQVEKLHNDLQYVCRRLGLEKLHPDNQWEPMVPSDFDYEESQVTDALL